MYSCGLVIIRWASMGRRVQRRTAATTIGPMVMLGTKWPSMTSTWMRWPPPASASRTCSPRRVKSADRMDGTIAAIGNLSRFDGNFLRNRAINHPGDFAIGWLHNLGGIFVGIGWPFDHSFQRVGFVRARCQEED